VLAPFFLPRRSEGAARAGRACRLAPMLSRSGAARNTNHVKGGTTHMAKKAAKGKKGGKKR